MLPLSIFGVIRHRLKYQGCEKVPPRPRWAKFEVVSRGLLASLVTLLTNARIYIWNCNFHYNPDQPAATAGTAEEAFFASACQKACADAVARGKAMGYPAHRILPVPYFVGEDGLTPDGHRKLALGPVAVWLTGSPNEGLHRLIWVLVDVATV